MAAQVSSSSGVTAESLYRDLVWPALWKVLQLTPPLQTPPNAGARTSSGATKHERCAHDLQRTVTQALLQLLHTACLGPTAPPVSGVSSDVMQEVVSHLLLHPHGTEKAIASQTVPESQKGVLGPPTVLPAAAAAAVEVERLYLLMCTAIHLCAQMDVAQLAVAKIMPTAGAGATSAPAANAKGTPQLPWGVTRASKSVVAGIFSLLSYIDPSMPAATSPMASNETPSVLGPPPPPMATATLQQQQSNVQQLWFTFLCVYLQQLSAHTPRDTTAYAHFFASCSEESRRRLATAPVLSDDDDDDSGGTVGAMGAIAHQSTAAGEAAALQAWSHVSADLLRDTIARTRFRRAALLFKSYVPHMLTQAPAVTFLLADVLSEFARRWTAFTQRIPLGCMADDVVHRLARYDARSIVHGESPAFPSQQWHQCIEVLRTYGDRLMLLLGAGTPHGHLLATTLCAVLSTLYVLPYTRGSVPFSSASETGAAAAGMAAAVRGKRDEEAAVVELEMAHRQPRRASMHNTAGAGVASSGVGELRMGEVEWRLRRYAPFGQLLAYTRLLELQKIHLFAVATTQLRGGRTMAQHAEHTRMLALAALYSGVTEWDLTLSIYHFAECPLNPFNGPDTPPPALPTQALARYTAAVQQYVEHTRVELIMDLPFTELRVHEGGAGGSRTRGIRRGGAGGNGYGQHPQQKSLPCTLLSSIPSRGELHTRRFLRLVHPDPMPLNWRLHLTAAAASVATTAARNGTPGVAIGGGSSSTTAATSAGVVQGSGMALPPTAPPSSTGLVPGSPSAGSGIIDLFVSPCSLVLDLLVAGHYALAADGMRHLAGASSVNVLLPPRRAYPLNISIAYYVSILLRRWLQQWDVAEQQRKGHPAEEAAAAAGLLQLRDEVFCVLHSFLPILSVVQSFLANQLLLVRLLTRLAWMCQITAAAAVAPASAETTTLSGTSPAPPTPNAVFALTEHLLIAFVMPCVRVLPPAPMVYDVMEEVLAIYARFSTPDAQTHRVVLYGENAAMPLHMFDWLRELLPSVKFVVAYRTKQQLLLLEEAGKEEKSNNNKGTRRWPPSPLVHPHDALLRKEREALLSQSLKRLNAENLVEYRALLRPILYAEPLLVAHRLLTQAVGYNNSFLDVHTRLLHGLPGAVLMLVIQQGLVMMARYAAEEKISNANGDNRVAILATFVATLWRDNLDAVDGALLVRRVELALRSNSGEDILLGTELCKALLAVMAHRALEHEEKYNPAQLQALAYAPSTTSLFGRGAMTSFRARCWKDTASSALLLLSPVDVFAKARQALLDAMQRPCLVPIEESEDGEANEEDKEKLAASGARSEHRLTLGQHILLHLCRLQSDIYELQRDLDGGAELILLSSAGRFNMINDMLIALEEMSPPPTELAVLERLCTCVQKVGLPHVASLVETQQRRKFKWSSASLGTRDAVPSDAVYCVPAPTSSVVAVADAHTLELPVIAQLLQHFTAAHFEYKTDPYDAARHEWQQCMERVQSLENQSLSGNTYARTRVQLRTASIKAWLSAQSQRIDVEESMHKHLYNTSAAARAALLQVIRCELASPTAPLASDADDRLVELAASYLLPRAALNLREAVTVAAFFTWIFQESSSISESAAAAVGHGETEQTRQSLHRRAIDLALTFVTAAFTYFVAFTDGECKRLGCVLQRLLQVPALSAHQQQLSAAARLSPSLLKYIQALSSRAKVGGDAATAAVGGGAQGHCNEDVSATPMVAAASKSAASRTTAAAHRGKAAVDSGGLHMVSKAVFESFLHTAHTPLLGVADTCSTKHAGSVSLLSLAVARGLVSSPAQSSDSQPVASPVADALASTLPAVPLQLESYICRAMLQLLTHEQDVPAYAHRNLFLILEQLDKSTFPATLCALDLLICAVEPHASKTKSYYALASAVLKMLRVNRRNRRELQHAIAALRHREEVTSLAAFLQATCGEEEGGAVVQLRTAAAACHGERRLDEHYMRQLLQNEAAVLLKDAQVRRPVNDDSDVDEEDEEGTDGSYAEKDAAEDVSPSSGDGEGSNEEGGGDGDDDDVYAAASAEASGEEGGDDGSETDADASGSGSEGSEDGGDDGGDGSCQSGSADSEESNGGSPELHKSLPEE
ncbi:hypothetical protein JKF63_05960 [Porcisia hertigi]|uniref:Uncharacterized protein n=1 Tax=Porcisia hertigi TaxID=2761500 RepID=A0A836HVB4_9TRYP|nr:hypothetical protein JKF63_05960 [Porcisia hertigi]